MALCKRCRVDTEDSEYDSDGSGGGGGGHARRSASAAHSVALDDARDGGGGGGGGSQGDGRGGGKGPADGDGERCTVLGLPNEVLAAIMQLCTYTEVAESQRLVCRRFAEVASLVLNAGLYRVGTALDAAMVVQEASMESATTDNEMAVAARAFCALEFARMQWRLVEATVWRHGAAAFGLTSAGGGRACCFGGRLLDRLHDLCRLARNDPVGLAWSFHYGSSYRATSARRRLAHDTKRFLNVFEKYAERRINAGPRVCASKLVDLLLSLEDEKCIQVDFGATGVDPDTGLFRMRACFVLRRAWFTCLPAASPPSDFHPRERQRYMFLRVRRLVAACNENALERTHYEREALMRLHTPWRASVSLPFASKYAAFGHYAGQFFYYGALNDRAYEDRFRADPFLEILGAAAAGPDGGPDAGGGGGGGEAVDVVGAGEVAFPSPPIAPLPAMEVRAHVRLVCPPAMAPLAALRRLQREELDPLALAGVSAGCGACSSPGERGDGGPFALELELECAASAENRLPSRFVWRVSDDDADADGSWVKVDAPPPPPPTPCQPRIADQHASECLEVAS